MSQNYIENYLDNAASVIQNSKSLMSDIESTLNICKKALEERNTFFFCGNGGSASDSQHLAAELIGRYQHNRRAIPALSLTVDTSAITAIANDFGFENVFSRQLEGLGKPGDILFALSTSGKSENVINAMRTAKSLGILVIGLTGEDGSNFADFCDSLIQVPSKVTCHIQEAHIAIGQLICGYIEDLVLDES
jgi:D-sedoheptulose 7-phosphate isomerase